MSKILRKLAQKDVRFLTIKGIPGMNKIDLVELIAQHLNERNIYKNGILKIRIGANYKTRILFNKMEEIFIKNRLIKED